VSYYLYLLNEGMTRFTTHNPFLLIWLAYLFCTSSTVYRRTPLDDAIEGKYWRSAKLLSCFGATHTVELTPDAAQAIEETAMDDIRELVRAEKVTAIVIKIKKHPVTLISTSSYHTTLYYLV